MTAVTRGEVYARQHGAARRDQRDRARLPGAAGAAVRGRRLRDRLDGDHQGHAQPRRREEVLRLGADAPRRRRSASTSRSTRFRPTAASPLPPQVPKLTDIKVIDYDFAKYGAQRNAQAPARALGEGSQRRAAMTRAPRAPLLALARGRRAGFLARSVVRAAGLGARAGVARATGPARSTRRRSLQIAAARSRAGSRRSALLLAAAALLLVRALDRGRARNGACSSLGAAGFAYTFAQGFAIGRPGATVGWRDVRRARGGQYGMGLGACLVLAAFAMLLRTGARGARLFQGRRVRRRQRRRGRRRWSPCSRSTRSSRSCCRRSRTTTAPSRSPRSSRGSPRRRSGASAASSARRALRRRVEHAAARAACALGCTALGLAFALIVDAHRVPLQARAARAVRAADHHAAVRDRPRPHPAVRPLGARQPVARVGVRHRARRAGSTACRACSSRRCSRSRRSPSSC